MTVNEVTVDVDGIDVDALRLSVALHRNSGYVILEISSPLLALVECAEAVLAAHDKGGQWVPWCDEHDALGLPCGGSFIPIEGGTT